MTDHLDAVLAGWEAQQPAWDLAGMAVFGRISRLERLVELRRVEVLRDAGLTSGDVDVLAALWRHPDGLRPKDLRRSMMVGSGTLTARLDRLEADGLVRRRPDPEDQRGCVLALTARGRSALPDVVERLLRIENDLLRGVPPATRRRLAADLRRLLTSVEDA